MNCTSRITAAFAAAAFIGATGALAADLTVNYGESTNITANTTYDKVTVNGDLIVEEGVTLTCGYFYVGKANGSNRATVTLQNNARLEVPDSGTSDSDAHCLVGNPSPATVTLMTNSVMSVYSMRIGVGGMRINNSTEAPVKISINDGTLETTGNELQTRLWDGSGTDDQSCEAVLIELNGKNALLNPRNINLRKGGMKIRFNGGLVKFNQYFGNGNTPLVTLDPHNKYPVVMSLESENGSPLRFLCSGINATGANAKSLQLFKITGSSADNKLITSGLGEFRLEGDASWCPLLANDNGIVEFGHTGGFRVSPSAKFIMDSKTASAMAAAKSDLILEAAAKLDLNGIDLSLDGVDSAGTVVNTSATAATLTVGINGGDANFGIAPSVPVVKAGTGTLRIPDGSIANVSVQDGTLALCDRAAVGYPYYRFWVRGPKGNINLSEFALLEDGVDVSQNRTGVSYPSGGYVYNTFGQPDGGPTNLFDRISDTTWNDLHLAQTGVKTNYVSFIVHFGEAKHFESFFYDGDGNLRGNWNQYGASTNPPARPPVNQRVTAYSFAYGNAQSRTPCEWIFQGATIADVWKDLDHVTGFPNTGYSNGAWCGTNFVVKCGISEVSVGSLTVGDNATWAIDMDQADIDVGTLTAGQNVRIVVSNAERFGSSMVLPVAVSNLSGNLGSWRVALAERPGDERGVKLENGHLCTDPMPTVILMK